MTATTDTRLRVEHVLQPALLVRDMDRALDRLHAMLGIFPSERVDIKMSGVNNAVYAFHDETFLELIEPYDPGASAGRLLDRYGEGWHMVSLDVVEMPPDEVEPGLDEARVRVVFRDRAPRLKGGWHLHPRDTGGVLLALYMRQDTDDNTSFAGEKYREFIGTNIRVVRSIAGVSLVTDDLAAARDVYTLLGFAFGSVTDDAGDALIEAATPRGTFLQVRSPSAAAAPSAAHLARRGAGQFHIVFSTDDLVAARVRLEGAGVRVQRETVVGGRPAFWSVPETTFGVPFELRQR